MKTETETDWLVIKPQPSPQEEEGRRGAETVVGSWSQEKGPRGMAGALACLTFGTVSYRFFPISDLSKNRISKFISIPWTPRSPGRANTRDSRAEILSDFYWLTYGIRTGEMAFSKGSSTSRI